MTLSDRLFRHENREADEHSRRTYARFEIARTFVEFAAAICFLVGSVMFFYDALMIPATWFFTIGSLLFAARPTLKIWREVRLYRMGKWRKLAQGAK
ncbi:YrhK family protein [Falsirhodobacter halotolerans]|uniref:YrhK family protein n=1 Tax=Falsirhodobacter halotolerans TaxID=1146892 RepID=UPI001FD15436|nr:YrhK family protein [Falsirhodobacter halotolerans]MCJ8140538.1 YrhK family protein [Falsirhodobacter halotolerans]